MIATELPAEEEDDLGPQRVVPGVGDEETLRRIAQAAFWLRMAAFFAAVAALTNAGVFVFVEDAQHGRMALEDRFRAAMSTAFLGGLCTLVIFGPLCALLWAGGSRLAALRLHGVGHFGLFAGIFLGLLLGGIAFLELAGIRDSVEQGISSVPAILGCMITAGAAGLALVASFRASWARGEAIARGLHRRVADLPSGEAEWAQDQAPQGLPPHGGRLQRARLGAGGLRMTALALALWYPLSCVGLTARGDQPRFAEQVWVTLAWNAGFVLLVVLMVGAQNLASLAHSRRARAGCFAGLLAGIGFGIEFLRGMAALTESGPPRDFLLHVGHAGLALAAAVYSLHASFSAWQITSDVNASRAFRD